MNPRPRHYESRFAPFTATAPHVRKYSERTEPRPNAPVHSAERSAESRDWAAFLAEVFLSLCMSVITIGVLSLAVVVAMAAK